MPTKQQLMAAGAPYPPMVQALGSPATKLPDVPASAVFLALYALTGIAHMALYVRNKKGGHKFVLSGAMFAYCLMRVITFALRLATVYNSRNISLNIAAAVFVAVGTVILYVVNFFFAQRLMRARHGHIGWHPSFRFLLPVIPIVLTALCIIMVVVSVIQSFFTLNERTRKIDRHIQQGALTWFTVVAFLPIPIIALVLFLPRKSPIDKFGAGRHRTKVAVLAAASVLLTLGAAFRCGINFLTPVPLGRPSPWYYSKACFYVFDFALEYAVVLAYLVVRVDKRFHVPNGAHGRGAYAAGRAGMVDEKSAVATNGNHAGDADPEAGTRLRTSDGAAATSTSDQRAASMVSNGTGNGTGRAVAMDEETEKDTDADADAASVTSDTYALSINRKSGRYEMRRVSQSTLGANGEVGYVEKSGP